MADTRRAHFISAVSSPHPPFSPRHLAEEDAIMQALECFSPTGCTHVYGYHDG
jgi:hypothetical protein